MTAQQIFRYLEALLADPEVPTPIQDLHDLSRVSEFQIDAHDVQQVLELSQRDPARIQKGRLAIIAPQDHVFGMSRMLELLAEHAPMIEQLRHQGLAPKVAVFRTRESARQWLLAGSQSAA